MPGQVWTRPPVLFWLGFSEQWVCSSDFISWTESRTSSGPIPGLIQQQRYQTKAFLCATLTPLHGVKGSLSHVLSFIFSSHWLSLRCHNRFVAASRSRCWIFLSCQYKYWCSDSTDTNQFFLFILFLIAERRTRLVTSFKHRKREKLSVKRNPHLAAATGR